MSDVLRATTRWWACMARDCRRHKSHDAWVCLGRQSGVTSVPTGVLRRRSARLDRASSIP